MWGLLAAWVLASPLYADAPTENQVWIIVRPRQCMSNPWEKDWLARHKNQVAKYPRAQEYDVMKKFFLRKQVKIHSLRVKAYLKGDPRCETCDCGRGDTWFLLVSGEDVPKMVSWGYTERMAAQDTPEEKSKK